MRPLAPSIETASKSSGNGPSLDDRVLVRQMTFYCQQSRAALVVYAASMAFLVFSFWGLISSAQLLVWVLYVMAVTVIRLLSMRSFLRRRDFGIDIRLWQNVFMLVAFLSGMGLTIGELILFQAPDVEHWVLVSMVVLATMGVALGAQTTLPGLYVVFALPALVTMVVAYGFRGGYLGYSMAIAVGVLAIPSYLAVSRHIGRSIRESLRLGIQNEVLVESANKANQTTTDLLRNILPDSVIQELSATGKVKPARHEEATILFTDFANFTQTTSTMPASRMVTELNDVFAAFDDIIHDEGVEKIKTIGDAYMAAAGLSGDTEDHAERSVRAALRMLSFIEERNRTATFKWALRVGLHSGPVISGVVGKRKYAFDIWGDTVNVASRMESSGEAGQVNVSAYTYDLIRSRFDCSYRGKISAKGKGDMDMYFVIEQRDMGRTKVAI